MIKGYQAGLSTITDIVVRVRYELYHLNEKKLADKLDDVDYLLGLMMRKDDKTEQFVNYLKQEGLYDYYTSRNNEYKTLKISCPHCKKVI